MKCDLFVCKYINNFCRMYDSGFMAVFECLLVMYNLHYCALCHLLYLCFAVLIVLLCGLFLCVKE